MQLRSEQLPAHLAKAAARGAGGLAAVYTIHGDEPLLALEAADAVRAAARGCGFEERTVLQVERGFDWSALRHAGASASLFAMRRIVDLRVPGGKPGTQGAEAIVAHCSGAADPDLLTLVSLPRLDRTAQGSAWFGALAGAGVVVEVHPVERARLPAWIGERLARQEQRAGAEVLEFLAERVEGNLLAAHQEVLKLALLAPPGELALETVREAVANVARYDAYAAAEALLAGELARYARVIEGLKAEGEAATLVLWVLAEDLRVLGRLIAGERAGRPLDALMRENRVWRARAPLMRGAMRRHAPASLERALLAAARIDRAIKGLGGEDPWEGLLRLGLELIRESGT